MNFLKSKDLLLIAPHFKTFIHGQATSVRPFLNNVYVLKPMPLFSSVALHLPHFRKYFKFLSVMAEPNEALRNCTLVSPKFFTLPLEALRKRNCYLASRSCIKALSKNAINFSLIHAHFLGNGFIGATLKSLFGKPFVVTAHGGDVYSLPFRDSWYNALARYVLSKADRVITVSQYNAEKLLSLGVSSNKLHVIPNGYDKKLFRPIPLCQARKKLGLSLNKKMLLSIGNLVDAKGHTYLVDAVRLALKKRNDVILVIVGSGPLKERLLKKVRDLGLDGKILFIGGKRHDEIPMWINASDLFVLPSLSEGFPTVIPEAMACGKPVVGTRVGGIPEAMSSNELGILVPPKDAEMLSQAILDSLNRKWQSDDILNYAEQYSWGNITKRILAVYRQGLA